MKKITLPICHTCEKVIMPREGIIVQGNIYVTTEIESERRGIIGNNISGLIEGDSNEFFVNEQAFHLTCFTRILEDSLSPFEELI